MGRGIVKGVKAKWEPTCAPIQNKIGKGPHEVIIDGNDHGRVYCLLEGNRYGDYECAFEKIPDNPTSTNPTSTNPTSTNPTSTGLEHIGHLIRTQDNRATAEPIFIVQERVRDYGYEIDCCDNYKWISIHDYCEADEEETKQLDEQDNGPDPVTDWYKSGYKDRWEFVTVCFTEQGCKDYIKANGHNLNDPRIYVDSAYRNTEFIAVRDFLSKL